MPYRPQRIMACWLAYYFCWLAFNNELYYEFILEVALTSTSMWYHTTESPLARKVDISTLAIVVPSITTLSIYKNNYYPAFFNALALLGYYYKSVPGTMREHFLYVHIPALMSQLSTSLRLGG